MQTLINTISHRFLGCTDINTLSATEQKNQAFHLGIAALLGEGIYNLGELVVYSVKGC